MVVDVGWVGGRVCRIIINRATDMFGIPPPPSLPPNNPPPPIPFPSPRRQTRQHTHREDDAQVRRRGKRPRQLGAPGRDAKEAAAGPGHRGGLPERRRGRGGAGRDAALPPHVDKGDRSGPPERVPPFLHAVREAGERGVHFSFSAFGFARTGSAAVKKKATEYGRIDRAISLDRLHGSAPCLFVCGAGGGWTHRKQSISSEWTRKQRPPAKQARPKGGLTCLLHTTAPQLLLVAGTC